MIWNEKNRIAFGDVVRNARERHKLTQTELAKRLAAQTQMPCSQKKICNIELGYLKRYLDDEVVAALRDILSLSEEDCMLARSGDAIVLPNWISINEQRHLLTSAVEPEFKSYLGKYHCVFKSTETTVNELIHCDMNIYKADDGTCDVTLCLHISEKDLTKRYTGKFFINDYFDVCYIILCGNTWQEVCMMIAPRFKAVLDENKFFTPLVLTTSAGKNKRPTVHRMLISRKKLQGKSLELAASQLLLNNDYLVFKEAQLEKLETEIQQQLLREPESELLKVADRFCAIIRERGSKEAVIRIEESDLLDIAYNGGTKETRAMATAFVRKYTDGVYHNKISKAGPSIFNTILDADIE